MKPTAEIPPHVRRATELVMDCIREAAPGSTVSVELSGPENNAARMMNSRFTFTAPGSQSKQCVSRFVSALDAWPDDGEFLAFSLWLNCRKAFGLNPEWSNDVKDGIPKNMTPPPRERFTKHLP